MINENRVILIVAAVLSILWAYTVNDPSQAMSAEATVRCGSGLDLINGFTRGRQGLIGSLRWAPLPTLFVLPFLAAPKLVHTGFAACIVAGLAVGFLAAFLNGWFAYCRVSRWFRYPALMMLVFNPAWQNSVSTGRSETLFALLIVASCCMLIHWLQTLELRSLAYLSILCAMVVLTRYQAIVFVGLVFAIALAYLLVEREQEAYAEGTLLVLLSPTVYAVALWFAANWLIMGDPLFFFRGLACERAAGVGWRDLLLESCEWSFCLLPLLLALGAWLFTQMGNHVVVRVVQGFAVVALAAVAMFGQVRAKPAPLSKPEIDASDELDLVVAEIEKDFKLSKVVMSGYMGYEVRKRIHSYSTFIHVMSIYLDKVLKQTRGQDLYFLVPADKADGRWEDMNLTYPGIYDNGTRFTIFERAWQHWRLFKIVRTDSAPRPGEAVEAPSGT